MEEQLAVKTAGEKPSIKKLTATAEKPEINETGNFTTITEKGFCVKFDNKEGTIYSLEYNGKKMICDGQGPKIDALRAPTDNDNWPIANGLKKDFTT